jgi:hypothetical protein
MRTDFVDTTLLLDSDTIDHIRLAANIPSTFRRRGTHDVPPSLPVPPASWAEPFGEMAAECGLEKNITKQHQRLASFLAGISKQ